MAVTECNQCFNVSQIVFVSICTNLWECGLVAIDDITVNLGDCQITTGKKALECTTVVH